MSDDLYDTSEAQQPVTDGETGDDAPGERTYTAADVERIVRDRVARVKRTARKAPPVSTPEIDYDTLADRVAEKLGRGSSGGEVAEPSAQPKPSSQSFGEQVSQFLSGRADGGQRGVPTSDGGAPATAVSYTDGHVDVKSLTRDDIDRLKGTGRFHEILERYRTSQGGGNPIFGKRRGR